MEKVSKIIPPSARQVWLSGEIEKPKRVADPSPEERIPSIPVRGVQEPEMRAEGTTVLEGSGHRGTKLNMMA